MFQSKKPQTELKFTTRAEAFSYMLMYMTEENMRIRWRQRRKPMNLQTSSPRTWVSLLK